MICKKYVFCVGDTHWVYVLGEGERCKAYHVQINRLYLLSLQRFFLETSINRARRTSFLKKISIILEKTQKIDVTIDFIHQ